MHVNVRTSQERFQASQNMATFSPSSKLKLACEFLWRENFSNFEKVVIKKLLGEDEKEKSLFLKEAKILHVIKSEHKVKFKAVCMELFATMLEYLFFDFAPFGGSEVVSSLDQFL